MNAGYTKTCVKGTQMDAKEYEKTELHIQYVLARSQKAHFGVLAIFDIICLKFI
jgi:hypothetical protein